MYVSTVQQVLSWVLWGKKYIAQVGFEPTTFALYSSVLQNSEKYYVYSANTHRCEGILTKMNILYPQCKFNIY